MNVLLVSMDSARADHLSCYGYPRDTTPNLAAWAADGVIADRMFCSTLPTTPSHTSLFTSWHSLTHGLVSHRGGLSPRAGYPWLPSIVEQAGYTTVAVDNIRQLLPWFSSGFEFYIDSSHRHGHTWSVSTQCLNERTIPWLRQYGQEPFFLFLHVWDPHTPYLPPLDIRHRFYDGDPCDPRNESMHAFRRQFFYKRSEQWFAQLCSDLGVSGPITDVEYIVALYDACLSHMDEHLGCLLHELDVLGLADDTLVLLLADHGEMMGENDVYFDHHSLYDGNLRVPLLARWPAGGVSGGRRFDTLLQHVDIAPTVLEAMGQPIPEAMEGHSALAHLRGQSSERLHDALYAQECTWQAAWTIRTDTHKLIVQRDEGLHNQPTRMLFDLVADPGETRNVFLEQWELAEELEIRLEAWIAAKLRSSGLDQDPVCHENISLGRRWYDWLADRRAGRDPGPP